MDTTRVLIANSATEKPLSQIVNSNCNCYSATWISENQLACGYDDGTIEIHEIESRNRQLNSQMVQKIRHDFSHGKLSSSITMPWLFKKTYDVLSVAWNEELKLLASGGGDGRIKVFKRNVLAHWI